jgi:hypothetical protein
MDCLFLLYELALRTLIWCSCSLEARYNSSTLNERIVPHLLQSRYAGDRPSCLALIISKVWVQGVSRLSDAICKSFLCTNDPTLGAGYDFFQYLKLPP